MIEGVFVAGLNHVLGQSAWARARLAPFAGRRARMSMPPWQLDFEIAGDGLLTPATGGIAADVVVSLPAETPFLALQGREKALQAARVEGNAEFATELAFVLRNLRWDYEEDMSHAVGDIAAHRIAGTLRSLAGWQEQAARNLAENLAEYVTEENPLVARKEELTAFAADIAAFAAEVERAERHLARLRP